MSHDLLRQLRGMTAKSKIDKLLRQKFNGDEEACGRAIDDACNPVKDKYIFMQEGLVAQMAAFRKEVGEDMWATIASNPSLPQLLAEWKQEKGRAALAEFVEATKKILPEGHDATDEEISMLFT
jgi:predicted DsbA family dithiol-disulfide isomerase